MSQPPNLTLGFCVRYAAGAAEVFIRSFLRNVTSAAPHIFTRDIAPELAALLRAHDIRTTECGMALDLAAEPGLNIYSARHFILRHPGYGKVLRSDVRDVVLQDRRVVPMVHQWDRQDHLRGPVVRTWRQAV